MTATVKKTALTYLALIACSFSSQAHAAERYRITAHQTSPNNQNSTSTCVTKNKLCFLYVDLPTAKGKIEIGIVVDNSRQLSMEFMNNGNYLTTSKEGFSNTTYILDDTKGLSKTIKLYRLNPQARSDSVTPKLAVQRPPNIFIDEIKIDVSPEKGIAEE